jgi:hypothetical protein
MLLHLRYTDQQLDREFIDVLREACFKLIEVNEVRAAEEGGGSKE